MLNPKENKQLTTRLATPRDILNLILPSDISKFKFLEEEDQDNGTFLLLQDKDEVVGIVKYVISDNTINKHWYSVRDDKIGRGYGTQLTIVDRAFQDERCASGHLCHLPVLNDFTLLGEVSTKIPTLKTLLYLIEKYPHIKEIASGESGYGKNYSKLIEDEILSTQDLKKKMLECYPDGSESEISFMNKLGFTNSKGIRKIKCSLVVKSTLGNINYNKINRARDRGEDTNLELEIMLTINNRCKKTTIPCEIFNELDSNEIRLSNIEVIYNEDDWLGSFLDELEIGRTSISMELKDFIISEVLTTPKRQVPKPLYP